MKRKEERLRREIDRIALQLLMEIFHLSKISFIKQIRGAGVLEATSLRMRETDTTDRINHLLAK